MSREELIGYLSKYVENFNFEFMPLDFKPKIDQWYELSFKFCPGEKCVKFQSFSITKED